MRTNDHELVFVCDVPGVKRENLDVILENQILSIHGSRRFERTDDEQVMLGRAYGSFKRSFTLPDYLDDSKLDAHLADGVLTIRIPKQPKAKPRKVQITLGPDTRQLKE